MMAILVPCLLPAVTRESFETPSGLALVVTYRALQPGEPLLFVLKAQPGIRAITVNFLGKTVVLKSSQKGGGSFAFLGVDLDIKPGTYPLSIQFEREDGSLEGIHKTIAILIKEFSTAKLWVRKDMVTPPKSVEARIKRESEIMALVFSLTTPEWLGDGDFIPPHPAESWSNFGQRRVTNSVLKTVHAGVDVMVPPGDPIKSVNAGRVVLAGDFYLSGKTVIVDHGLGIFSFYCHLSKLTVKRGNIVQKGQVLGNCGSTGRSTGPHLHWAMRIYDSRVDPYALVDFPIPAGNASGFRR